MASRERSTLKADNWVYCGEGVEGKNDWVYCDKGVEGMDDWVYCGNQM